MIKQKKYEITLGMCFVFSSILIGVYVAHWQLYNVYYFEVIIPFFILIGLGIYCAIRLDKMQVKNDTKKSNE